MKVSDLMQAMADAGAPMKAIVIAVQALEDAQLIIDNKRTIERDRKRRQRANDKDTDGTVTGPSRDTDGTVTDKPSLSPSPNENNSNPHPHTLPEITRAHEGPDDFHVLAWVKFTENRLGKFKTPRKIPDEWMPVLTENAQKTVDGWPPGAFDEQLAAFRDHAADKGRTSKDWQAAFRTWITNSNRWTRHDRSPTNRQNPSSADKRSALTRVCDEAIDFLDIEQSQTAFR